MSYTSHPKNTDDDWSGHERPTVRAIETKRPRAPTCIWLPGAILLGIYVIVFIVGLIA